MTGLARRRHDRWRVVQKALRLCQMWDGLKNVTRDERGLSVRRRPSDPERLADNLANCTCAACLNPHTRKWHERRERAIAEPLDPP